MKMQSEEQKVLHEDSLEKDTLRVRKLSWANQESILDEDYYPTESQADFSSVSKTEAELGLDLVASIVKEL